MARKKRLVPFAATASVLGLFLAPLPTPAEGARVLAPADGAEVGADQVLVVLEATAETRLLLDRGGKPEALTVIPHAREGGSVLHSRVSLPEGTSHLRLLDARDERELASLTLTRREALGVTAGVGAVGEPYLFHTRAREAACTGCHALPGDIAVAEDSPASPAERVCDGCHRDLDGTAYLHGPMAVYACFTCHDPASRPARFALREGQPASCRACHADVMAQVMGANRFAHGPVAVGQCTVCHGPHGGVTPALLRSEVPELCLRCHGQSLPAPVARGLHAKVLCTECHGPHGGATPVLTAESGNGFCVRCHRGIDPEAPGHPILGHPVQSERDRNNPSKPMGCVSCHPPHGHRDIARSNFVEDASVQRRFCIRCHA